MVRGSCRAAEVWRVNEMRKLDGAGLREAVEPGGALEGHALEREEQWWGGICQCWCGWVQCTWARQQEGLDRQWGSGVGRGGAGTSIHELAQLQPGFLRRFLSNYRKLKSD